VGANQPEAIRDNFQADLRASNHEQTRRITPVMAGGHW